MPAASPTGPDRQGAGGSRGSEPRERGDVYMGVGDVPVKRMGAAGPDEPGEVGRLSKASQKRLRMPRSEAGSTSQPGEGTREVVAHPVNVGDALRAIRPAAGQGKEGRGGLTAAYSPKSRV